MTGSQNSSREVVSKVRRAALAIDKIADQTLEKSLGLTMSHFWLLVILNVHRGVSQKVIARFLGLTQGAISRQIEVLRAKGLVSREDNPACRREHVLALTAEGERQFDLGSSSLDRKFDDLLSGLDQEQKDNLAWSLDVLLKAISAHH